MTFKTNILLFVVFCMMAIGLGSRDQGDGAYIIGPNDLLTINVFDVPELNTTVRVSEDGKITLPLLGVVPVQGLDRTGIERRLAALLEQKYLKDPQVSVYIEEYQSKRVSVMGAVKNAGSYELVGRRTLLQILSLAGGLTEDAADRIIVIRRQQGGNTASMEIRIDDLLVRADPKTNIDLKPDDIVHVLREKTVDIFVFGQVKEPGTIKLKQSAPVTLLRAIAQAGGFAERAKKSSVLITREGEEKEIKFTVNVKKILRGKRPDFVLQANDIVFVKESAF